MEYLDSNPNTSPSDAIKHFAEELEIDKQTKALVSEVDTVLLYRDQLRPLYGQKADIEHKLVLLNSEFDLEIMMEYPPGKRGNADQRKNKKIELQTNSTTYQKKIQELKELKEAIEVLETKLYEVETRAKNARKIVDTFNHYVSYILTCNKDDKRMKVNNNEVF